MLEGKLAQYPAAVFLYKLFRQEGGDIRFVGGCVRDSLLGIEFTDIDFAINLPPDMTQAILTKNNIGYSLIGKEFGTITAIIDKQKFEITTLRKDIICDGRYAKVQYTDNWQEDAARRDFTINALSADLEGNIYDYFDGLKDLKQKKLRFIGVAEQRITEDYLRILRFFRFSSYFATNIDQEALAACIKYAKQLRNISKERIIAELKKIFVSSNALEILKVMFNANILEQILPCEANDLIYLERLIKIFSLFQCHSSALMILAIFLRNKNIVNDFPLSKHDKNYLKILVHSKIDNFDYHNLKQYWNYYGNNFKEVILINLAYYSDENIFKSQLIDDLKNLFAKIIQPLPISGNELISLGIKPGKEVGNLLLLAKKIWYDSEFMITKDELIKQMLICQ